MECCKAIMENMLRILKTMLHFNGQLEEYTTKEHSTITILDFLFSPPQVELAPLDFVV